MTTLLSSWAVRIAIASLITITASPLVPAQSALQAEDYAVYSALITPSEDVKLVVVNERLVLHKVEGDFSNSDYETLLAPLTQETFDHFKAKNSLTIRELLRMPRLSRNFDIKVPYVLLRGDDPIFIGRDFWEAFAEKYPGANSITAFSPIGFNSSMDQALVHVARSCGSPCGVGTLVVLAKVDGVWKELKRLVSWVAKSRQFVPDRLVVGSQDEFKRGRILAQRREDL